MKTRSQLRLKRATLALLDRGLRLRLARELTGLSLRKLKELDVGRVATVVPRGRPCKAGTLMLRLGRLFHVSLLCEAALDAEEACATLRLDPALAKVLRCESAIALYEYYLEAIEEYCVSTLRARTEAWWPRDALDVNEACIVLRDRDDMERELCPDCHQPIWRWPSNVTPRGCPFCRMKRALRPSRDLNKASRASLPPVLSHPLAETHPRPAVRAWEQDQLF